MYGPHPQIYYTETRHIAIEVCRQEKKNAGLFHWTLYSFAVLNLIKIQNWILIVQFSKSAARHALPALQCHQRSWESSRAESGGCKGSAGKSDGTETGKCVCTCDNGPERGPYPSGNCILLTSCLRSQRAWASPFLPPAPESKEGQGWHWSAFRFCSGITQLSPARFQLGQERWTTSTFMLSIPLF